MTLIVTLSKASTLCVASDTRAVSTCDGSLSAPVEKVRILTYSGKFCVVAIAGEAEINQKLLLDHASEHVQDLFTPDGIGRFAEYLFSIWHDDISSWSWDSIAEKENYIRDAFIEFSIIPSTEILYAISGTYSGLSVHSLSLPRPLVTFGRRDLIPEPLRAEPQDRSSWNEYLATVFREVSEKTEFVAPPIDLLVWDQTDHPRICRLSLNELTQKK